MPDAIAASMDTTELTPPGAADPLAPSRVVEGFLDAPEPPAATVHRSRADTLDMRSGRLDMPSHRWTWVVHGQ